MRIADVSDGGCGGMVEGASAGRFRRGTLPVVGALLLLVLSSGCATTAAGTGGYEPTRSEGTAGMAVAPGYSSESIELATAGVRLIEQGRLEDATDTFNQALRLNPANSWMQFLNGLTYHLRALRGDGGLYDFAAEGYKLAVKFDSTNWVARYHLGLLYLDRRMFPQAQEQIAEALLFNGSDPDMLYDMVVASYNARDPRTAGAVLSRLRTLEPDTPRVLRASALVLAALDRPEEARGFMERYAERTGDIEDVRFVNTRVDDWNAFFDRNGESIKKLMAAAETDSVREPDEKLPEPAVTGEMARAEVSGPVYSGASHGGDAPASQDPGAPGADKQQDRMVIVDVVIVRTDENITSHKGVNLLNGLAVQFGYDNGQGTTFPGFVWGDMNPDPPELTPSMWPGIYGGSGNILTGLISFPALTYTLNIFNSHVDRAEILARPTLVGLDGERSEFFSGVNINAVSDAAGQGQPISINTDVGVKLVVTPTILGNNLVKLVVEAERKFLRTPSDDVQFDQKFETTKTLVTATVEMKLGETLILSGLSEKETESRRDGVPFLKEIPGIQYFFSQKDDRDFQRSVLVLLTPRMTEYVYHEGGTGGRVIGSGGAARALTEFQSRYSDWFKPYPNWASVFHHMQQSNSLYREFRTGDVTLERWENQEDLGTRLRRALRFLYF